MSNSIPLTLTPERKGRQLVRFVQPLPDGFLLRGSGLALKTDTHTVTAAARVLSSYPDSGSARAALVTCSCCFPDAEPLSVFLTPVQADAKPPLDALISLVGNQLCVKRSGMKEVAARLLVPGDSGIAEAVPETVEHNAHCLWQTFEVEDPVFPYTVDVRVFSDGTVCALILLQ